MTHNEHSAFKNDSESIDGRVLRLTAEAGLCRGSHQQMFENPIIQWISNVSHIITTPVSWNFSEFEYAFDAKYLPGRRGQWSTKRWEMFHRGLRFLRASALLPYSLSVGIMGILTRTILFPLKSDFIFIHPDSYRPPIRSTRDDDRFSSLHTENSHSLMVEKDLTSPAISTSSSPLSYGAVGAADSNSDSDVNRSTTAAESFHLASWNIAGLPEFASNHNLLIPLRKRYKQIAKCLLQSSSSTPKFDVVCLQEAFQVDVMQKMINILRPFYPFIVNDVGPRCLGLNSGLCVLSRIPISEIRFWPFFPRYGDEVHANKGLLGVKLEFGNNKVGFVFTTHLNAGWRAPPGTPNPYDVRREQIKLCADRIRFMISTCFHSDSEELVSVSFSGDFNISDYYTHLREGKIELDPEMDTMKRHLCDFNFDRPQFQSDGVTPLSSCWSDEFDVMFNEIGGPEMVRSRFNLIDHILVDKRFKNDDSSLHISYEDVWSDHCLIHKTIPLGKFSE